LSPSSFLPPYVGSFFRRHPSPPPASLILPHDRFIPQNQPLTPRRRRELAGRPPQPKAWSVRISPTPVFTYLGTYQVTYPDSSRWSGRLLLSQLGLGPTKTKGSRSGRALSVFGSRLLASAASCSRFSLRGREPWRLRGPLPIAGPRGVSGSSSEQSVGLVGSRIFRTLCLRTARGASASVHQTCQSAPSSAALFLRDRLYRARKGS
jgi:hypothetical protein